MYLDPEWGTSGNGAYLNRSIPTYQTSVQSIVGANRNEPDVSLFTTSNGPGTNGQNYGVPIVINGHWSTEHNYWPNSPYGYFEAGTSLSAPLTAGILNSMNITNSYSTDTFFTTLYNNWGSDPNHVRDITSGTTKDDYNPNDLIQNQYVSYYIDPNVGNIYSATPCYDIATG